MVVNGARLVAASAATLIGAVIAAGAVVLPGVEWRESSTAVSAYPHDVQVAQVPAPSLPEPAPAVTPAKPDRQLAAHQNDAEVVLTLVRTTMAALDQANVSGNYTVLRDIGAPGFRADNSAADLARIFAPIRDAKIDLSSAVILDPHIGKATLNEQQRLYVTGALETKPVPVNFELLFEPVAGHWLIFGISVKPQGQIANAPAAKLTGSESPGSGKSNRGSVSRPTPRASTVPAASNAK